MGRVGLEPPKGLKYGYVPIVIKQYISPNADRIAAELAAQKAEAEAKAAAAALKKKTITCIKGKSVKKVIAIKPVCPKGYKLKK